MRKMAFVFLTALFIVGMIGAGLAEGTDNGNFRTEEIWVQKGNQRIYGVAHIPQTEGSCPLVIFSHGLGNNHESGARYAQRLAEKGIAVYAFDFCGGSASGVPNRSDGTNAEMSVLTEADDLEAVLEQAKSWEFVDREKIFLMGESQGGLVTIIAASRHPEDIAGMVLLYPALSARSDHGVNRYPDKESVPEEVNLFGGWMRVGRNYITDLWDLDFDRMLAGFSGKVLLLRGDQDGTVDLSWSEQAARVIPDCEFHVIRGGGHEFYGQPFEDAAALVQAYLDEQLGNETGEGQSSMKMKIGDTAVQVKWEENESVEALKKLAANGLTIQMSMYGGFEQVGSIGSRLPSGDVQTNTSSGDIVLYSSSQLVVFYGSNSWAYTRLGKITDRSADEMRELLGRGDVTITLSAE